MKLLKEIQDEVKDCMRQGKNFERDALRVIIGEAQKINLTPSDNDIIKVLKKNKEGNLETISYMENEEDIERLKKENELYDLFLPKTLSGEQIEKFIQDKGFAEEIKSKKSIGQAMGFLMGSLKKNFPEYIVDGNIVSGIVKNYF